MAGDMATAKNAQTGGANKPPSGSDEKTAAPARPAVSAESADALQKEKDLYPMSNWKYDTFLWSVSFLADIFFREIHPRGSWKVPRNGPVLFVAAPHNNQVRISLPLTCSLLL